jgi:hypothetical protein
MRLEKPKEKARGAAKAEHIDIRAYNLARRLLEDFQQTSTPEGRKILQRLSGPMIRAQVKATKPPKSSEKREYERAETKALEALRQFIIVRGTRPTMEGRIGRCWTCEKMLFENQLQAGHWIRRRHQGVRYHPMNVHPQCTGCNNWGNGKEPEHEKAIRKYHPVAPGETEWPERLKIIKQTRPEEKTKSELLEIAADFEARTARLLDLEAKGLRH